ncbi:MAG: electron transfer flavoprotein-ubiquinone oxidoreductase [Burkholderiaceae bacterium]|nr:electron transfer flavoprotein-ubiquinone oxidoreductase [Burkholderiaceae bacterium]
MNTEELLAQYGPREAMDYDLVIVGGGPAGLSAAIHAKQIAQREGREISVCVLEKGSEVGAHILSGAIMDPRALNELFPDWQSMGAPLETPVSKDEFIFLTESSSFTVPHLLLPNCFSNRGNYILSLSNFTRWLGGQAEQLGVDIFPGFAAAEILFNAQGAVCGVATGNLGIHKDGNVSEQFQLGMELRAKYTLFAEGSRGHLGKQLITKYRLDRESDPQSYGIGIKELWEVTPENHRPGLVIHTAGWPLDQQTYGGSFLYHFGENKVAVGMVVGLSYRNPYLSPFDEFQRYKLHPAIRPTFEGGKRLAYGARAITAGGLNSLPQTVFPGGALIGCDAGYLNASRIKGSHAAIKSGMLAAQAAMSALSENRANDILSAYPSAFKNSWLYTELKQARNFKAWMSKGLYLGTLMVGIEQKVLGGNMPWTIHQKKADYEYLEPARLHQVIEYPKPDGRITFDRLSSVFISNTNHEENQPAHLTLKDESVPVAINLDIYAGPEQRYCPAGVYEYIEVEGKPKLQINAQNCVHCKTCDIKDPTQNIVWVTPEGGGGPNYSGM